ncbi:hypothetical protein Trebr_2003 [Treponema brennaborense DSM 12168]|uniref:Outer membrane protein beta-barrel domain-containing protein n=2 Tax=Treponema TaxID=157 RepID=F4LJN8_TREBD|nr:hypothetical protein Trebr_2003 [Treponema brennaborense DSM 12168]
MNRMNRIFISIACLCVLPLSFGAADEYSKQNEIQLKIGMFPAVESVVGLTVEVSNLFFGSLFKSSEIFDTTVYTIPVFSVEYLHNITERHAIGTTVTYGIPFYGQTQGASSENVLLQYVAATFKYRYTYWQNAAVRLYGATSLGCEIFFETPLRGTVFPFVAFQEVPIGIQFGGKTMFGTAEIGAGSEGSFLVLGAGMKF